jgi:membrane-associated phospholipid phosphatase
MGISDEKYLNWQKRLGSSKSFRRFWTFCAVYIIGFGYLGVLFFFFRQTRTMAILAFLAFLLARFVVEEIIYLFYKRQRPAQRLNFVPPTSRFFVSWLNERHDSMPSGHAASLAAVSTVCFIFLPWLGNLCYFATLLNSLGRIVVGYHHFSDVLAGWFIGIISALAIVYWIAPILFTR